MRDSIVVEIDAPLEDVAELYFDPSNNARWMEDVERCEPVNGAQGKLGSIYRMLPKQGSLVFETRVVRRQFPHELELRMSSPSVVVDLHARLSELPGGRTRLSSQEWLDFRSFWDTIAGQLARPAIRRAHRAQIEAFRDFAERELADVSRGPDAQTRIEMEQPLI